MANARPARSACSTAEVTESALGGREQGMRAERAHLHEEGAVHMSHGYTSAKMATLPCAAPTVWRALEAHGRMMAAETVLVLGTGGVKVFALQITTMFDRREAGQVPLQPRALLRVYAMAMPQSSKA